MAHRSRPPRAQRGETFIEVLVALLIVALSTLLLTAMVGAAGSIDRTAYQQDQKFYEALSLVETMENDQWLDPAPAPPYNVTITKKGMTPGSADEYPVEVYNKDNFTAYRAK